jgi:ribosomal protein S18 acetylase RimI-like enzyme
VSGLRSRATADGPLRCSTWRGRRAVALLTPVGGRTIDRAAVHACLDRLEAEGYARVVTAALSPADQDPFLDLGFEVRERLHLLVHHLGAPLPRPGHDVRRARRADRAAVLAIDGAAFHDFWRLDETGLDDALDATPVARFRVIDLPGSNPLLRRRGAGTRPAGYAITGRAGARGYLQRLAVEPEQQGSGIGTSLVGDSLRWARRHGVREVLVNTQVGNDGAVRLYERLGFERRPEGLVVLDRALGGAG